MAENLKQKAAKGMVWKLIGNGGTQAIQFFSGIYIARILSPNDYGLVGMMAIFLGISQVFIDSGFRATLIQKGNNITHDHYNVVFIFNLVVSIAFYLAIFFGAPFIADFYGEPQLLMIARILGLNLIFISLGLIHQTILEKSLKFRSLAKARLSAILVSTICGIVIAILGFGVWSLVIMNLLLNLVYTIIVWVINRWSPSISFDFKIFKELFKKSIQIFSSGILNAISNNIYSLVIGKLFSTADVGFFSQGEKLQKRISSFIGSTFQGVMYPVQSLMQDDIPRLKNAVRRNVSLTSLVSLPALVGLIAIARPFVLVTLTEKWAPSIYFLQLLSLAGIISTLKAPLNSYILALGKFDLALLFSVLRNSIFLALLFVGIFIKVDLKILVLGIIIAELLGFFWAFYYAKKIIGYTIKEFVNDIFLALIFAIFMGFGVYILGEAFKISILLLLVQVISGAVIYLFLNLIFNQKLYVEIKDMIINSWNVKK
ncbi:lipopolysaccharide biosynthesis protein [Saccharicrinis sp. FJH62]|uniref:lipopolysaccharide biosynthesis protein n=1 Tax=Saccharicrinis sp. FJH62 TaxID=3344657 RepID=UPI0035D41B0F